MGHIARHTPVVQKVSHRIARPCDVVHEGVRRTHFRGQDRPTPVKGGWHGVLGRVPRAERKRQGQGSISLAPEDEHTTGTTPTGSFSRTSTQQRQRLEVIQHLASLYFYVQSSHEDDRTNVS